MECGVGRGEAGASGIPSHPSHNKTSLSGWNRLCPPAPKEAFNCAMWGRLWQQGVHRMNNYVSMNRESCVGRLGCRSVGGEEEADTRGTQQAHDSSECFQRGIWKTAHVSRTERMLTGHERDLSRAPRGQKWRERPGLVNQDVQNLLSSRLSLDWLV